MEVEDGGWQRNRSELDSEKFARKVKDLLLELLHMYDLRSMSGMQQKPYVFILHNVGPMFC